MRPALLTLANAAENPATFEYRTPTDERLHIIFFAFDAGANAINSLTLTLPNTGPVELPRMGFAPLPWRQIVNGPQRQTPTLVAPNPNYSAWPLDTIIERGESIELHYDVSNAPFPPITILATAYGWWLAPGEQPLPMAQITLPTLPTPETYTQTWTLPPAAPQPPPAQTPAVPPGPPVAVTWDILNATGTVVSIHGQQATYPTRFTEDNVGLPIDPTKITIPDTIQRTLTHLYGAGLHKARAIRASLTGRLHAGPYFIQSDTGNYITNAGAPTTITPSFVWEQLTIECIWGRAQIQTLNAQQLNDGVDITAEPIVTVDPGERKTLTREVARLHISTPAAPPPTDNLYVRYHGER